MDIKQEIMNYSKAIEIDAIGFCPASPKATNYLDNAKSFIVILESYDLFKVQESPGKLYGKISRAALFEDYHKIITIKLEKLKEFILETYQKRSIGFCDTGPFLDREIAEQAGLGAIGKNSFLINHEFGTAFYIGYLLTELEIKRYDERIQVDPCKDCTKCILACPGNSISSDYPVDFKTCISYLTQAKHVPNRLKSSMKNNLYGCDVCQLVCPYNKHTNKNRFQENLMNEYYPMKELLNISNVEFKNSFRKTSAGWRGKKILQRNAIIALGNLGDEESIYLLKKHLTDKRVDIRMEIIDSLGRINSPLSREILKNRLALETDEEIKEQIIKYLL